jgi:hypothetical protein
MEEMEGKRGRMQPPPFPLSPAADVVIARVYPEAISAIKFV